MLHRRHFLSAVALTPIAAAIPVSIAHAEDTPGAPPSSSGSPSGGTAARADAAIAAPSAVGRDLELAGGFVVVRAFGVHYGAMPFVIEGEGERFQLDVLRPDPRGPSGVYETAHFSVFVSDRGSAHTLPACERGARALGAALERRLATGVEAPELASFVERRAAHPTAAYDVDFDHART